MPDDLPHDYVLDISKPYLGTLHLEVLRTGRRCSDYKNAFKGFNQPDLDRKDPWQFKNFLVTEAISPWTRQRAYHPMSEPE